MKKRTLILCSYIFIIALLTTLNSFAGTQMRFYVSPDGNDNNSGTIEQPYATIQKAKDVARTINNDMTGDIIIYLREGIYELEKSLTFSSDDSGTNGFNIIYQSYNCETAVISGGIQIKGWVLEDAKKNIYKASIDKSIDTRQLYVNGVRAVRARSIDATGWSEIGDGYDCPGAVAQWKNIKNVEVVSYSYWKCHRGPISSVNGTHCVMAQPYWDNLHAQYSAPPKWIENAYELLDTEGEWYLDRSTGTIFYKPKTGEDIFNAEVILPKLETLMSGTGVSNIQFKGITFTYATWLFPNSNEGFPCAQADALWSNPSIFDSQIPGNITFSYSNNLVFERNKFEHLGVSGLQLYTGCKNNKVYNNTFQDISGSGIVIGDIINYNPAAKDLVKGNIIDNNYINNVAEEYEGCVGIFAGFTEQTVITHNEIRHLPYTGISAGWGWTTNIIAGKNNEISYNLIDSVMLHLFDGGAIYTLGAQPGAKVHHNYVKNQLNEYAALYLDAGSSYMRWHHNVVENGFHWTLLYWYDLYNDTLDYNFYDCPAIYFNGINTVLENNVYVSDGNWPPEALNIMKSAGRVDVPIAVNNVSVYPKKLTLLSGKSYQLASKIEPCNATNSNVLWQSLNPAVANVNNVGFLTAKGMGTTKIILKSMMDGATSDTCIVTIKAELTVQNYTKELISCAGTEGNFIICAASVSGGVEARYQWCKDCIELTGETKAKLMFSDFDYPVSGLYKCKVYADGVSEIKWSGDIPVYALSTPEITEQPKEVINAQIAGTYHFKVKAQYRGMVPPYLKDYFQWYKYDSKNQMQALVNDSRIAGATSSELVISGLTDEDICQKGDYYIVEIVSQCGTVRSNPFIISQKPEIVFSKNPSDAEVCPKTDVVMEANAIAPAGYSVTYAWQKDNAFLTDNSKFNGVNTSNLQISDAGLDEAGYYKCVAEIASEGLSLEGVPALLMMKEVPEATAIGGVDYSIKRGDDAIFKVDLIRGAQPLNIKWSYNGEVIKEGIWDVYKPNEFLTLILESINENQAGEYICSIENECAKAEIVFNLTVKKWDETGITENENSIFSVTPNPAGDFITINLSGINPTTSQNDPTLKRGVDETSEISIYNTLGEKVMTVGTGRDLSVRINISDLPRGLYFIQIDDYTEKFMVIR